MKTDIIIQARMGSTRLPGKIMLSLAGKPVLWHDIERCKKCKNINDIIITTTTNSEDDIIERWCINNNVKFFRGSSSDVLNRYYETAKYFNSDIIVRITSDCPLVEPEIIDGLVQNFDTNIYNYSTNCLDRVFPRGFDTEVFTFKSLEDANLYSEDLHEKEHVTPYIIKNGKVDRYVVDRGFYSDARLTLDRLEDYVLLNYIYDTFYYEDKIIDNKEVLIFLEKNKDVKNINLAIKQKDSIG